MTDRQLHLLSPYRLPTSYPLQLAADETAAWLNGYAALWHPAALAGAGQPPQVANSYDHDTPGTGFVYAVPQGPHLYQPDDWADRAKAATAAVFHPTADRAETIDSLKQALRERGESSCGRSRDSGWATCWWIRSTRRWTTSGCSTRPGSGPT